MQARKIKCQIVSVIPKGESLFLVRFKPSRAFRYEPGQFLSVHIPGRENGRRIKRCYSLSSSPAESRHFGHYELCIKRVPGGKGSNYLAGLKAGDEFAATVPFGKFVYRPAAPERGVCFIATGTGVGPFRSMVLSEKFLQSPPRDAVLLHGVRRETDVLFHDDFERAGVRAIPTVSEPSEDWEGFRGRVTDLLGKFPKDWQWHQTDFYLCGSGEMASEVAALLIGAFGVSPDAIHQESFTPAVKRVPVVKRAESKKRRWWRWPSLVKAA